MKPFYFARLIIPIVILLGWNCADAQMTYTTPGGPNMYTVPAGVTAIGVDMAGAQVGGSHGGNGGRVQCNLAVSGGQVLYIYVGGNPSGNTGGANGGGNAGGSGNGGGGGSDIRTISGNLASRVVVAGGGGGGSSVCGTDNGGIGGTTGGNGTYCGGGSCWAGSGATQLGSGSGSACEGCC